MHSPKDLTLYQAFDGYLDGFNQAHIPPNNRQKPGIWSEANQAHPSK